MKSLATPFIRLESIVSDLSLLIKARLNLLVLFTTWVGFVLGSPINTDYRLLIVTLVGTALSACGAAALNQWWERDFDARMARTRNRPLPAGRMHPTDGLLIGIFFSLLGVILLLFTNVLSSLFAALTIASYIFLYTPMKRISSLNTLLGAIAGAFPPLIGYTAAAQGYIGIEGWILFFILWFWQMPHFLAIAWMYRDQYSEAGFVMLSKNDPSGKITSRQTLIYTAFLLPISLLPAAAGFNTTNYAIGAFLLGSVFIVYALAFARQPSVTRARTLFFASVIYLPLLLGLLVATKR